MERRFPLYDAGQSEFEMHKKALNYIYSNMEGRKTHNYNLIFLFYFYFLISILIFLFYYCILKDIGRLCVLKCPA